MKETRHPYLVAFATIVLGFLFAYMSRFLTLFSFFAGPDTRKLLLAMLFIPAVTAFCSVRIFSLRKEAIAAAHIFLALLAGLCFIGVYNLEATAKFFGLFSIYNDYESAGALLLLIMLITLGLTMGFAIGRSFANGRHKG